MVTLHTRPVRPGSPTFRLASIAAAGALALALAACSSGSGAPGGSGPASPSPSLAPVPSASEGARSPAASSRQMPLPSPSNGSAGAVPDEILQAAIADAARETGVDPSTITVTSAVPETWTSGALGCPEPGVLYTQALVPGYRIKLDAGGKQLEYHASESGTVKLCRNLAG